MKSDLSSTASLIRAAIIKTSGLHKVPHLASCLSCTDILIALYWEVLRIDPLQPYMPNRDFFLLSKGHAAPALHQVLAHRGFFPKSDLENYGNDGSLFGEHPPAHGVPGIEAATGSLGHGLPIGIGLSLGSVIKARGNRVFVLMGDGECNEGSVWEGAMMAPAHNLENLMVIIDYNKWQATGRSEKILSLNPLCDKWRAFGWNVHEIDGHNMNQLTSVLNSLPDNSGKPVAVIAHTVKGKGVSFIEDDNNWHYRTPTQKEIEAALEELGISEEKEASV